MKTEQITKNRKPQPFFINGHWYDPWLAGVVATGAPHAALMRAWADMENAAGRVIALANTITREHQSARIEPSVKLLPKRKQSEPEMTADVIACYEEAQEALSKLARAVPIEDAGFSVRTRNRLLLKCRTLEDVAQKTEAELCTFGRLGRKSVNEVKEVLYQNGLTLRQ